MNLGIYIDKRGSSKELIFKVFLFFYVYYGVYVSVYVNFFFF